MLYPPLGQRGMAAMSRASRFGTTPNYLNTANRFMSVIVQLETPEAIGRLEEIAAVPGIDALFIGPGDLSASMGHVGNAAHPEVLALTHDAVRRAHAAGKKVGTVGGTPSMVRQYREMGFDFVAIASDLAFLVRSAQAAVQELSGAAPSAVASASPFEQNKGVY
jgi:2-keto-3-deoxy-L-rhamnonate aldolase RhmA